MRLLLTIALIICIKNSYSQTSAQAHYTTVYNLNQAAFDSVKQESFYTTLKSIVIQYPKDEFTFTLISKVGNLTYQQLNTLIHLVDSSIYNSPNKASADNTLKRVSIAETGKTFPPLILTDTTGEEFSISNMKGKILYIDVWSSWCGPCREEIPEIKKIYKKYNSMGLEIIGISIDSDKQKWLKAIREDKQTWKAYCELKDWRNNKFAKRFSIYSIPANFLIDEKGILVAQDLSPESLKLWLAQHN